MMTSIGMDMASVAEPRRPRGVEGRALLAAMFSAAGGFGTLQLVGITGVASLDVPGLSAWLGTRWAWCLGLPMVSVLLALQAVGVAAGIAASTNRQPVARWGWRVLLAVACVLGAGGVWYIASLYLSPGHAVSARLVWPLGAGVLACITVLASLPRQNAGRGCQRPGWGWAGLGFGFVVLLVASQALGRVPPQGQELSELQAVKAKMVVGQGAERRLVPAGGLAVLRLSEVPLLGPPEAPHLVYQFFDYRDPASFRSYRALREARQRYGGQIAIVMLVFPLDESLNPRVSTSATGQHPDAGTLARLSLAVWRTDRSKFETYNDYLLTPRPVERSVLKGYRGQMVTLEDARARAEELVGRQQLEASLADPWVDQEIARHIAARDRAFDSDPASATVPVTCVVVKADDGTYAAQGIIGAVSSSTWLFQTIESKLGIKPAATQVDAGDPILRALKK